jgi:hypothetical protein
MPAEDEGLTAKQEQAIAALLVHPTIAKAAAACGVAAKTITRWLKLPAFLAAWRSARQEVEEHAIGELQKANEEAADVLRKALKSKRVSDRIRAAVAIFEQSRKHKENIEYADQIRELQRRCEERGY